VGSGIEFWHLSPASRSVTLRHESALERRRRHRPGRTVMFIAGVMDCFMGCKRVLSAAMCIVRASYVRHQNQATRSLSVGCYTAGRVLAATFKYMPKLIYKVFVSKIIGAVIINKTRCHLWKFPGSVCYTGVLNYYSHALLYIRPLLQRRLYIIGISISFVSASCLFCFLNVLSLVAQAV
jgi:hypothetical protein